MIAARRSALEGMAQAGTADPGMTTLTDAGLFDAWSVGGRHLHTALAAVGLDADAGQVLRSGDVEAWGVAPDEVLLMRPAGPLTPPSAIDACRSAGALVTEVGAGLSHVRLAGPGLGAVLESVCAVDLSERALAPDRLTAATVAGMRVTLVREAAALPAMRISVARDLAMSLWEALVHAGATGVGA